MRARLWGVLAWALLATGAFAQEHWGTVTLLRGGPVVIRGSERLLATEGARIEVGDILETGPQGMLVIEAESARIGLGPGTSAMAIAPSAPAADAALAVHLLRGAMKYASNLPGNAGGVQVAGTLLNVMLRDGAAVVLAGPTDVAMFLETGEAGVFEPLPGMNETLLIRVKAREYYSRRAGSQGVVLPRFTPEFLSAVPKPFTDNLPARLARHRNSVVTMKAGPEIAPTEMEQWMESMPALRKNTATRGPAKAAAPANLVMRTETALTPAAGRSPSAAAPAKP